MSVMTLMEETNSWVFIQTFGSQTTIRFSLYSNWQLHS